MTYNVHLLLHLADCVRHCGPLWAYSAFHFEGNNGVLIKLVNGTTDVLAQVAEKYIQAKSISFMTVKPEIVTNFEECLYNRRMNTAPQFFRVNMNSRIENLLRILEDDGIDLGVVEFFERVTFNNQIYTTSHRCENLNVDDSAVEIENGDFGTIYALFKKNNSYFAVVAIQNLESTECRHIFKGTELAKKVIAIDSIRNKCVHIPYNSLFCKAPNHYEKD